MSWMGSTDCQRSSGCGCGFIMSASTSGSTSGPGPLKCEKKYRSVARAPRRGKSHPLKQAIICLNVSLTAATISGLAGSPPVGGVRPGAGVPSISAMAGSSSSSGSAMISCAVRGATVHSAGLTGLSAAIGVAACSAADMSRGAFHVEPAARNARARQNAIAACRPSACSIGGLLLLGATRNCACVHFQGRLSNCDRRTSYSFASISPRA